ncbi:hypothetical protein FI667_g9760, partial [Globisporangium splendens]
MTDASVLHPYRKRKFFYELAALLQEEPPRIQRLTERFPPAPQSPRNRKDPVVPSPSTDQQPRSSSSDASSQLVKSSAEPLNTSVATSDDDSFECVEFDGLQDALSHPSGSRHDLTSQGSVYESTQDSAYLVPIHENSITTDSSHHGRMQQHGGGFHFDFDAADRKHQDSRNQNERQDAPTTLINGDMLALGKPFHASIELDDYYDWDRLCEITPCWMHQEAAQCEVHADDVACPMLLFCLQVTDEFIAYYSFQREETWRVQACKLAQSVFVARWDAAVLNQGGRQEIDLQEYLLRKKTLVGVAYEVWRIVGMYWDKYKQSYLHQHELYFADHHVEHNARKSSKWNCMRDFFHVYGMKASQASKLADVDRSFTQMDDYLSSKQLSELLKSAPRASPLHFGVKYLNQVSSFSKKTQQQPIHRHVISQPEWKIAFNAIVIHLQKWISCVHVFPCGSFSRGAAYGSTIDILVALPEDLFASREKKMRSRYDDVVATLSLAKIVQQDSEHRVSATRGLFVVPYKKSVLILDLKVYERPKSWFALLYFTGPQHFVHDFYCSLLQISLQELPEATFDAIYAKTVAALGLEKVASVECEKDIFDLAGREYLLPSFRM